ncbi:MAG: DNA-3-methyladenine glycosylase 2 family protein [Actinobacteria bacterium]|nr:DNA-3-methyladenine glycosylase 2 family protein [Actinomycetota bacterium]
MRRYEVAQRSMVPNLRPGQEVVATDSRPAQIGDVVVFEHPHRPGFWMIKRMAESPAELAGDQAWVLSDNPAETRADSRTLGPLPRAALLPVVERLDAETFAEASLLLADEDESLAAVVAAHGVPRFWSRRPGFATLVWLIMEQQVSLESGVAMYRRLAALTGQVTPGSVAAAGENGLRSIGVTRQKTGYLLDLAGLILGGELDLEETGSLPDDEARSRLLAVRGIGPWTADVYLLSALRYPDVFPVGDRALQVGMAEVLGLETIPDPEEMIILARPWRPVRAAAARLIWHAYLSSRGRVEPPDPLAAHDDGPSA